MSGINRSHQMLSHHSALRKPVRWYKKVAIHSFEIFVANLFYLYMKNTTRPKFYTMKEYKEPTDRFLVGSAKPSTKIEPQANSHYLCSMPVSEKKKTPTRTCKHCST